MKRVFRIAEPWKYSTKGYDTLGEALLANLRQLGIINETSRVRFYFGFANGAELSRLNGKFVSGVPSIRLCVEVLQSDHEERYDLDGFPA